MARLERITVAMQCFWGAEAIFGSKPGIITTKVGYAGGQTDHSPTYRNIGDHIESVHMQFDPEKITFEEILEIFFRSHDPTIKYKRQYISAVFYENSDQQVKIEQAIKSRKDQFPKAICTEVIEFRGFTNAEAYHQKYFLRKYPSIMKELDLINDDQLIQSPLAAKLNGMCAGFGTLDQIDKSDVGKLSPENLEILDKLIKAGPNLIECGV